MQRIFLILSLFFCFEHHVFAFPPDSVLQLGGFVRGVVWAGSENNDYTNLFGELAIKVGYENQMAFLKTDLRLREGFFLGERKMVLELKEAYTGLKGGFAKLYLGNQIIKWGRTDGFNPTDNINPSDYFFLSPDQDDQKLGNFMIRSIVKPSDVIDLELIVLPVFKPSVYKYNLFGLGDNVTFSDYQLPATTFGNGAIAARFNYELPAIGFSFSYFNGYDPFYGYRINSFNFSAAPEIVFVPDFYRKQSFGFDFAIPVGKFIIRSESALNLTKGYENNIHIPNPDFYYVGAMEFGFAGITAIAQFIGKYTIDYKALSIPVLLNPMDDNALYQYALQMTEYEADQYNRRIMHQQKETNNSVFLSLRRSFAYEMVAITMSGLYDLTSQEYLFRSDLKWKVSDAMTLAIGGNLMNGPEKSIFSHAGKVLNGLFLGLTVNF